MMLPASASAAITALLASPFSPLSLMTRLPSKPVMWSVVEKTALAEAEVEYEDYTSDTVWVKFPVKGAVSDGPGVSNINTGLNRLALDKASVVIWTTTPWTLPGNRAISFSPKII